MRAVPRTITEADREIERFARQVDTVIVGRDAQIDRWMGTGEGVEARKQPTGRKRADDANLQNLSEPTIGILVERRANTVKGFSEYRDKRVPFVGER